MVEQTVPETVVVVTEPFVGPAVDRWRGLIDDALALRPRRLVVDLCASTRIDAAAIVMLLQVHRQMVIADGRLVLYTAGGGVRQMLSLARVDHVLQVEDPGDLMEDM
jgi:anti-anti-sigma regulatory factor